MPAAQPIEFQPFLIYAGIVFVIAGIMIGLSWILGEQHKEKLTAEPYESGIAPTGNARLRFSSHFYLIAIFFVIFDLDAVFILAWAVSFRELGLPGYLGIVVFIGILLAVLVYEIGIGSLDFGPQGKKILKYKNRFTK
ncbi:MAG TPA: NADH-quinone oxidoreductase subunit A [Bacteroidales bacterium]|jgi:NADH-quinone oxidoreductase subunit A|nr:NADH-quinone oxidoreductase subunit A [Bacteroidales bacterium]